MPLPTKTIAAACALLLAGGLAGCGDEEPGVDEPAREGLALELSGVDYNVFITRQLNPAIPPDNAYYKGPPVTKGQTLYGVFLQACNRTKESQQAVEDFKIKDAQGNEFEPEDLPEDNKFAYHPAELLPHECIPEVGSVAQLGPTAGSMILFRLPLENTEYRPLELEVEGAGEEHLTFELDI
jgi:hypothetical protein